MSMSSTSAIKSVTLIGSGKVATALGKAFVSKGITISQVYSRTLADANELAEQLGSRGINSFLNLKDTDLLVVAVSDDAISTVIAHLKTDIPVVHTSGNTALVERHDQKKSGVFYPLQTFTEGGKVEWQQVPICIEASDDELLKNLFDLGTLLSENVKIISSAQRKIIHTAAVIACNFTNHMGALAEQVLKDHQLELELLKPLMEKTFSNMLEGKIKSKQTGPAVREDYGTIHEHMKLLEDDEQIKDLYLTLSKHIIAFHHGE